MPTLRSEPDWLARALAQGRARDTLPGVAGGPSPIDDRVSEKEFQAEVVAFAKRHGWRHYHTHDARKSVEGFPDLVLLRGAVQVVAELKVGDNTPTAAQLSWLDAFRDVGAKVFIWFPSNWPEIQDVLQ